MPKKSQNKVLVSGSIAYDFIMQFDGTYKNAILKDHIHDLNISFLGEKREMHFGGCGGNIAYGLALVGENPLLYGMGGKDFKEYADWLKKCGVSYKHVGIDKSKFTAAAYILTDKEENQITIFSPGAMDSYTKEKTLGVKDLKNVSLAILSPDMPLRTMKLAKLLKKANIPYFFDPGQLVHVYSVNNLKYLCRNAFGFISNSYEVKVLRKRLRGNLAILKDINIFVETLGKNGSKVRFKGKNYKIKCEKPRKIVDPTGCGDAFRAGFLAGLIKGQTPQKACKFGAIIAVCNIEQKGTQNYK